MNKLDLSGLATLTDLIKTPESRAAALKGAPLHLALDDIEEDPDQPRKHFDEQALGELADSIRERGVLQAIRVRPHPDVPGRYVINEGARRWRASRLAGKTTVPAVVDSDHQYVDQLIENAQREDLTVRETINAVARLLADGMSQTEIARRTGKGKSWVSRYAGLRVLPGPIASALEAGRFDDVRALFDLRQCWDTNETATQSFLDSLQEASITRSQADALRARLTAGGDAGNAPAPPAKKNDTQGEEPGQGAKQGDAQGEGQETWRKPVIQLRVGNRAGVLLPWKPAPRGLVWVEYETGEVLTAPAPDVRLVAVIEGRK